MKHEVEILLVEDNPNDDELAMRALRRSHFLKGGEIYSWEL